MVTRRSLFGLVALAASTQPSLAQQTGRSRVSPGALGSTSALEVIPEALRAAVVNRAGTPDLAPYLNEAIQRLDAAGGGTLFFPAGTYDISTLDLTQRVFNENGLTLVGAGREQTILRAATPGAVLLDGSGRNNLSLADFQIQSLAHASICGLLLARLPVKQQSLRNRIQNIRVMGSFSVAGVISVAAESNSWIGCLFENSYAPSGHCCFLTSSQPGELGLPPQIAERIAIGSNTDNVMTDCEFYAPFPKAAPVRFAASAGYTMLGCSVIAGGVSNAQLVAYQPREAVFDGPVTWHSPHFEVFGTGNTVHSLQGEGTCFYHGINSYSGNYQVSSNTLLLGQEPAVNGRPVIQNATWTAPKLASGMTRLRAALYGAIDSNFAFDTNKNVSEVEISGFAANSHVTAAELRIAQRVVGNAGCI